MARKVTRTIDEVYRCPKCKLEQTIWRPQARKRERGHKKDLWCVTCQAVVAHVRKAD